jgi:hypothetical protein
MSTLSSSDLLLAETVGRRRSGPTRLVTASGIGSTPMCQAIPIVISPASTALEKTPLVSAMSFLKPEPPGPCIDRIRRCVA